MAFNRFPLEAEQDLGGGGFASDSAADSMGRPMRLESKPFEEAKPELGGDNQDAQKKKAMLAGLAGITDAMSNGLSFGEAFLGRGDNQDHSARDNIMKVADTIQNPEEQRAKVNKYMMEKYALQKAQKDAGRDEFQEKLSLMQSGKALDLQNKIAEIKARGKNVPRGYAMAKNEETGESELIPARKPVPAETAVKLGNLIGAIEASKNVQGLGQGLETGRMSSMKDSVTGWLGTQDEGRAKSLADIATQRNEVMSRIAGANVTGDEKSRILEGIQTNADAPDQFQGKAKSTNEALIRKAETEIAALDAAGYDVSGHKANLAKFKASQSPNPPGPAAGAGLRDQSAIAAPAAYREQVNKKTGERRRIYPDGKIEMVK